MGRKPTLRETDAFSDLAGFVWKLSPLLLSCCYHSGAIMEHCAFLSSDMLLSICICCENCCFVFGACIHDGVWLCGGVCIVIRPLSLHIKSSRVQTKGVYVTFASPP